MSVPVRTRDPSVDGVWRRAGQVLFPDVAADLQPGSYVYFCTVSSHRRAGMRGRLEVR